MTFGYEEGKEVLRDISFTVPQGRTFGVLGEREAHQAGLQGRMSWRIKGCIYIGSRKIRISPLKNLGETSDGAGEQLFYQSIRET